MIFVLNDRDVKKEFKYALMTVVDATNIVEKVILKD